MAETAAKELGNVLNDPEEPLTAEVEETAVGVAGCLKNVLRGASGSTTDDSSFLKVIES